MKLYSYWRSSAAYRARIAINIKQIPCEIVAVNLLQDGQHQSWYLDKNPAALVPALELDDGTLIRQSLALIDYLEQIQPLPRLIPEDRTLRAQVIAWTSDIAMEIHPISNLRVIKHLKEHCHFSQEMTVDWVHHWMRKTLAMLEQVVDGGSDYCFGDQPTLADVFLIPQMFNAYRWQLDVSPYPALVKITEFANQRSAFIKAQPENQSDAPRS